MTPIKPLAIAAMLVAAAAAAHAQATFPTDMQGEWFYVGQGSGDYEGHALYSIHKGHCGGSMKDSTVTATQVTADIDGSERMVCNLISGQLEHQVDDRFEGKVMGKVWEKPEITLVYRAKLSCNTTHGPEIETDVFTSPNNGSIGLTWRTER
jgi:hypothetical protein